MHYSKFTGVFLFRVDFKFTSDMFISFGEKITHTIHAEIHIFILTHPTLYPKSKLTEHLKADSFKQPCLSQMLHPSQVLQISVGEYFKLVFSEV